MPKPEIVMSSAFGMGFWIDEEGVFMSCPAFEFGSFDIENAVPVEDWDDFSVYSTGSYADTRPTCAYVYVEA